MEKLILPPDLQAHLASLSVPTLLEDAAGTPLGHFLPRDQYDHLLYRLAESQCPYSAEELRKMHAEPGAKSLAEFWRSMGQS
jgi:hypothetical protein